MVMPEAARACEGREGGGGGGGGGGGERGDMHRYPIEAYASQQRLQTCKCEALKSIVRVLGSEATHDFTVTCAGHGSDENNCAEFCPTSHHFLVNGQEHLVNFTNAGTTWGCADEVRIRVVVMLMLRMQSCGPMHVLGRHRSQSWGIYRGPMKPAPSSDMLCKSRCCACKLQSGYCISHGQPPFPESSCLASSASSSQFDIRHTRHGEDQHMSNARPYVERIGDDLPFCTGCRHTP